MSWLNGSADGDGGADVGGEEGDDGKGLNLRGPNLLEEEGKEGESVTLRHVGPNGEGGDDKGKGRGLRGPDVLDVEDEEGESVTLRHMERARGGMGEGDDEHAVDRLAPGDVHATPPAPDVAAEPEAELDFMDGFMGAAAADGKNASYQRATRLASQAGQRDRELRMGKGRPRTVLEQEERERRIRGHALRPLSPLSHAMTLPRLIKVVDIEL